MSGNLDKIKAELESLLGCDKISTHGSSYGTVVSFPYTVEVGSHKGREVRMGVSMQGDEPYPEYPPHWIHVSPPIDDGMGGHTYPDTDGREWVAMSRPPGDIWDRLSTKHMSAYLSDHLRRFWNNI